MLFNGPMVRAILDGRKLQTRRVVKLPPAPMHLGEWEAGTISADPAHNSTGAAIPHQGCIWHTRTGKSLMCPHGQPGDRLWVRENGLEHRRTRLFIHDATPGRWWTPEDGGRYGASYGPAITRASLLRNHKVRASIHMPRWACRLVLEITDVRVERLQAISEADAFAEGADVHVLPDVRLPRAHPRAGRPMAYADSREIFADLWDSTGGDWAANPWVWVIGFKRLGGGDHG